MSKRWKSIIRRLPAWAWLTTKACARIPSLWVNNRRQDASVVERGGPVVCLTTYGSRIRTVYLTIESIADGTVLPSRLILWLDEEALFHNLPAPIRRLKERGLEVRLTENFGPHTKYYPFVASEPSLTTPLVTADDDTIYPRTWLEGLCHAYDADSTVVNCYRARVIAVRGCLLDSYANWHLCRSTEPSFRNIALGVSGVIYPPAVQSTLKEAGTAFLETSRATDDLWLHAQELRAGFRTKQIHRRAMEFPTIPTSQSSALYNQNGRFGDGNDHAARRTYTHDEIVRMCEAVQCSSDHEAVVQDRVVASNV